MVTFFNEKNPLESSTTLNEKDAKAVWDILEPLTLLKERNEKFAKETKNSMVTQHVTNTDEITGLAYLQQSLCRYLCEFIASNCVTKVCKEKTTLCKRFKQAKRYITACE
jgi:predicted transglutaminase-like protease